MQAASSAESPHEVLLLIKIASQITRYPHTACEKSICNSESNNSGSLHVLCGSSWESERNPGSFSSSSGGQENRS